MKSISNPSGWKSLITFTVLLLAWLSGFSSRLFAVIRFESIIHEFDPWFNYRATAYMVEHGFYQFLNWFDERAWYPLGRIVGGTVYPGLMITSGSIHYVLHALNIPVHIRDICVFLAPIFSGLTAISTYLLTKELWSSGAGLFAACFIAIVPGYISRSVAGSYDNEGIAIFALQYTYYLWVKSVKTGSVFWACLAALSYFYMVSAWGGYVFIINLIPLHVFILLLMGRYSNRLFTSYTTFYILGLLFSMQIPFVGFQPIRTSEHMAASGVFALILVFAVLKYMQQVLSKAEFKYFFTLAAFCAAGFVFLTVVILTYCGVVAPWSGRFYSLWDTTYAKIHIPIIASVSEHQPTTWFSFFFDLHILVTTFPVGLWYCIKEVNDERVFVVLYAVSAVYFAGVMVRLMLTLTPVVCILSGIAFSRLLELFLKEEDNPTALDSDSEVEGSGEKKNRNMYDKEIDKEKELLNGSVSCDVDHDQVDDDDNNDDDDADSVEQIKTDNFHKDNCLNENLDDAADDRVGEINSKDVSDKFLENIDALGLTPELFDCDALLEYLEAFKAGKLRKMKHEQQKESEGLGVNVRSVVIVAVMMMLMMFAVHCTWVTSNAYSSPSIVLASYSQDGSRQILDDFREAYYWLSQNTDNDARVMSWWDYGYQIAGMANRTTLVDNNTWNNSHIALVGKAMSSSEEDSYKIMQSLDVDYVLIIFGGVIGYSGDDINKFLWMVRIAEGEHPKDIHETDYYTEKGEFRVDAEGAPTLLNCLMYKLSYYRFGELKLDYRSPAGFDRTRNVIIGNKNFDLKYLDEAYTTEHWLVRIYRVKKESEFNRPKIPVANRKIKMSDSYVSKKTSRRKKGSIKHKPAVVKGKKPSKL